MKYTTEIELDLPINKINGLFDSPGNLRKTFHLTNGGLPFVVLGVCGEKDK